MTTMAEVQEELQKANTHITRAISLSQSLTARDLEDEIDGKRVKTAWCTPVVLRNIARELTIAKGADTKAKTAEHLQKAHEWAFKNTEGLEAMLDGFSDNTIISEDWHDAAQHFANAQSIIDEEYERVNDLGW